MMALIEDGFWVVVVVVVVGAGVVVVPVAKSCVDLRLFVVADIYEICIIALLLELLRRWLNDFKMHVVTLILIIIIIKYN